MRKTRRDEAWFPTTKRHLSRNPLSWVKNEKLSKDELFNIKSDLKSDKKQYGCTSCDHRDVRIVWERSLLHPYIILDVYCLSVGF